MRKSIGLDELLVFTKFLLSINYVKPLKIQEINILFLKDFIYLFIIIYLFDTEREQAYKQGEWKREKQAPN